jgi:hypothetical protein
VHLSDNVRQYVDENGKTMSFKEAMDAVPGTFETAKVVGTKPKPKNVSNHLRCCDLSDRGGSLNSRCPTMDRY